MYKHYFDQADIGLNSIQMLQLERYYHILIEENQKYNLTAITDEKDVYIKHFLDSMLIETFFKKYGFHVTSQKMIDIGTGAGFPAFPIKILHPDIKVTCLDSLNKRINFLKETSDILSFSNTELIHGRAEDFGQLAQYRETYDFAVSRAVAELRLLLEFVMPFVKVNGYFVAYKSLKYDEELKDASYALAQLKTSYVETIELDLPEDYGKRELMIFKKNGNISKKYPRKPGIPKKSPL